MDETEAEDDRTGKAQFRGAPAPPLHADVDEAQRDHNIHGGCVEPPAGERRDQQREAVAGDEQRDQLGGAAHVAGQQDDTGDEQQVVPAADHVQEAQRQIVDQRSVRILVSEQRMR